MKVTTMLDIIQGFEKADSHSGLFIQKERSASYDFLSYPTLATHIAAYIDYFRTSGISKGTRVLFPFETDERVICAFFALIGIGAIPFSVKPYGLGSSKDSYLDFISKIAYHHQVQLILETPSIKKLDSSIFLEKVQLPPVNLQEDRKIVFADIEDADIAFVQFSSGSTSFPKGIPIAHRDIMSQIKIIANQANCSKQDRTASWLPLYHDMGLVGTFLAPLYLRHSLHLSTPVRFLMNPLDWLNYLSEHQITTSAIPDFAIGYCLKRFKNLDPSEFQDLDLSHLRIIFNGSEPIDSDNLQAFIDFLQPYGLNPSAIKPCYGMAEAVLMVTCASLEAKPRIKIANNGCPVTSVGHLMPGFEMRLKTEEGQICSEGEIGEIELKAGTLVGTYLESSQPFYNADGFFPTGDLGFIDRGELFICGRFRDRFKINGQSYFASDFEHTVESLAFIKSGTVAVIQNNGELVILIEMKLGNSMKPILSYKQQIRNVVLQQKGIKISVKNIVFISAKQLEKTSSGKLKRRAIAHRYQQGQIHVASLSESKN